MILPTQTVNLDTIIEFPVENFVETQGDFKELVEQINQLAEDRNDDDITDENTQETVVAVSLNQKDLGNVIVGKCYCLHQTRQA